MFLHTTRALIAAAAVCATLTVADAQEPLGDDVLADVRTDVVERLAEVIETRYYDAGRAASIAAELRTQLAAGEFAAQRSPGDLAAALTNRLVPHDRHFSVVWSAPDASDAEENPADWAAWARRHNYGFRRVEVLPGNIGYLDLRAFDDPARAGAVAHAAMQLLAQTDAVIVDLRHNGGGEPGMVALLSSYFFDEPVHLNSLYWREGDVTQQFWTLPHLPGARMPSTPLYVLTARRTGSAAEEFAYNLKTRGRATLVGRRTAGAANPGERVGLPHGFAVFVSTGTAINPITGENWEGSGVEPDVDVPSDEAFDVARQRALGRLLEHVDGDGHRRELEWALEAVLVQATPVTLERAELRALPGEYGDRSVRRDEEQLFYKRGERPERRMLPLGEGRFLLEGVEDMRVHFERDDDGRVLRLIETWTTGHQRSNPRS